MRWRLAVMWVVTASQLWVVGGCGPREDRGRPGGSVPGTAGTTIGGRVFERRLPDPPEPLWSRLRSMFGWAMPAPMPQYVVVAKLRWPVGETLNVCFFGGPAPLRRQIRDIALEWTRHANISFDFGAEPTLRSCGAVDHSPIRVAFHGGGYASAIGQAARPSGKPTLYLQDYDTKPPPAPLFRGVILHEFGHALAFRHEHQNPQAGCDGEFDWNKVIAELAKPPNEWDSTVVRDNLGRLPNEAAYKGSKYDRESVMNYAFEPWMFSQGAASPCYVPVHDQLSALDQAGAQTEYPKDAAKTNAERLAELRQLAQRFNAYDFLGPSIKKLEGATH